MKMTNSVMDMEMANYSDVLDPTYTSLEFENMQLLYSGGGKMTLLILVKYLLIYVVL